MRHYVAILLGFGLLASAGAGLIVEKNDRATFGNVTEAGDKIAIEVSVGSSVAKKYVAKDSLKYWSMKAEATNLLTGAKAAFEDKNYDVAKILIADSLKREPLTKSEAQELRNKINEAAAKAASGATTEEKPEKPDKSGNTETSEKNEEVKIKGKLYESLKEHLLDPKTGKKFDGKTWGKAEYFMLCFVSLKYAENRDVLRRLVGRYDTIKKDYNGRLECLFYPIDADATILAAQIPKMELPFPILKSTIAAKTSLIKHKTSSASFAIVDASGNVILKGDNPLKLAIDFEDKINE